MGKFVLFFTLLSSLPAFSQWNYVTQAADKSIEYVKKPEVLSNGDLRAWVKDVIGNSSKTLLAIARYQAYKNIEKDSEYCIAYYIASPDASPIEDSVTYATTIKYRISLEEFDCEEKRTKYLQATDYYFDGHSETNGPASEWTYDIPNTVGEILEKYVCDNK